VAETLETLFALHPALRDRVLDEGGSVRRHVNVFVASESIRHTGGLATPVGEGAEVFIMPAVSGGVAPGRALTVLHGE
jgi:molybdopterin converting factor small subunit